MDTRSVGGIALQPSNNTGGYYFMFIATGEQLHSYLWRQLPITRDVIHQVERLAKKEKQPLINKGGLKFKWSPGVYIIINEEDEDAFYEDYKTDGESDTDNHNLTDDEYQNGR